MRRFAVLALVLVADLAHAGPPAYDRADWPHWRDLDRDCQDTRQEVLLRDAVPGTIRLDARGCRVVAGTWHDPYTGSTITDPTQLDIDHIVPLEAAHDGGGMWWTRAEREAFANDPDNLMAVQATANRTKGARGPDAWRPVRAFWCEYGRRTEQVGHKYRLRPTWDEAKWSLALQVQCWLEDRLRPKGD